MGEFSFAKSPHPVDRTGATASIKAFIGGGGTNAVTAGTATGTGATGGATGAAAATTTGVGVGVATGAGAAATGVGAGAATGAADASKTKSVKAATSAKSSTVTIMGVPTGMSAPDPASIRIFAVKKIMMCVCPCRVRLSHVVDDDDDVSIRIMDGGEIMKKGLY